MSIQKKILVDLFQCCLVKTPYKFNNFISIYAQYFKLNTPIHLKIVDNSIIHQLITI